MTADIATGMTVRLHDGRSLGYAEYGDPGGSVCFYFHGTPGSRFQASALDTAAKAQGVRLIAPEQPGYGLSQIRPGQILGFDDWPSDVVELADQLNISRFAVLGVSGGGGYAAACAACIPERLTTVVLDGCLGPRRSGADFRCSRRYAAVGNPARGHPGAVSPLPRRG